MISSHDEFVQYGIDLNTILSRYNNSYEELRQLANQRRRLGGYEQPHHQALRRDYRRATYLRSHIRDYETLNPGFIHNVQVMPRTCDNCHRKDNPPITTSREETYRMVFRSILSHELPKGKSRIYSTLRKTNEQQSIEYVLCEPCYRYVTIRKDYHKMQYAWAGFIWSILSSYDVQNEYGALIWRFIPYEWRLWWIDSARNKFPRVYGSITMETPVPAVDDRTIDIASLRKHINCNNTDKNAFAQLRDACNSFLLPTVACPYGCSEYLHKGNYLPLDIVYQRYLPFVRLRLAPDSIKRFFKLRGVREDYIRDPGDEDVWLLNSKWKVMPTVSFNDEGVPQVHTCRHHKDGKGEYMIHTCRTPNHILPPAMPDQLCHVCIKPRTVNQMQRKYGSNSYQMFRQDGSFNGIDTCSCTIHGRFDFCSHLSGENEARVIRHRPDISALLNKLVESGAMSTHIANCRRENALQETEGLEFEKYYSAATYVPLAVCIDQHRETNNPEMINVINTTLGGRNNTNSMQCRIKRPFPYHLYPCQTMNRYGAMPPMIPNMTLQKHMHTELLWMMVAMFSQVEALWHCLASLSELRTSRWEGWLLHFITFHCFGHLKPRTDPKSPFSALYMRNLTRFMDVFSIAIADTPSLESILSSITSVHVLNYGSITDRRQHERRPGMTNLDCFINSMFQCNEETSILVILSYVHVEEECIQEKIAMTVCNEGERSVFHLRFIGGTWAHGTDNFKGETFMRHGGSIPYLHDKWWHQCRGELPIQAHCADIQDSTEYVLVYVLESSPNLQSIGNEYLKYLGGQSHYQCPHHKLPLIISTRRKFVCSNTDCQRKEHYCCPSISCSIHVCKQCVINAPENGTITYASYAQEMEQQDVIRDHGMDGYDSTNDSNDDELLEPRADDDFFYSGENPEQYLLSPDALNDFVTSDYIPDIMDDMTDSQQQANFAEADVPTIDENRFPHSIPTTNAGELPYEIHQFGSFTVSGHVLMNQCGTLLTRQRHQIKGSSKHHNMLQRLCATNIGTSVPLLQPEAMLFPSIFWMMVPNEYVCLGALPSSFLTESITSYGFQSLPSHVRTRMLSPFSLTSTDPRYIAWSYDMLTNLSATHLDTRVAMSRGLTAADDTAGGLGIRGGNDSASGGLLGSIDSSQMVKNLCAAQHYHPQDYFVTLTCNQLKHFGVCILKEWIDGKTWTQNFKDFDKLSMAEQEEVDTALSQAAGGLILRNWQEVCELLLNFIRYNPNSPWKKVKSIFARNEYQKEVGNLSHIHLMLQVDWKNLNSEEIEFLNNIIRADLGCIVRPDEAQSFVDNGILQSIYDIDDVIKDASTFLPHKCNERCQERISQDETRCRKPNYAKMSPDNTRDVYIPLPNDLPSEALSRLLRNGLAQREYEDGPTTFTHDFFNPTRHIPPINLSEDANISPVEPMLFVLCRSMQNIQLIRGTGGCNKYVCKYVAKIDEQNYVVVSVHENLNGKLSTRSTFLHNTKIARSGMNEESLRCNQRTSSRPQGRMISLNEMLHVMLRYPEVKSDLTFVTIPTVPLEQRSRIGLSADKVFHPEDGQFGLPEIVEIRTSNIQNQLFRQLTDIEVTILNDLRLSQQSVDRITQFSLRPPELREVFDSPGNYFRWFTIVEGKRIEGEELNRSISNDIYQSCFVDGLQRFVLVKPAAYEEICKHLDYLRSNEDVTETKEAIMKMFDYIIQVHNNHTDRLQDGRELSEEDSNFWKFASTYLVDLDFQGHLPVPVYSYTRPTFAHKFVLHILLSMGRFTTEAELTMHPTLRDCFRHAKLIGHANDETSLRADSDALLKRFIEEQLCYFPNSRKVLGEWIALVGDLFDSVIVDNEMLITEMPSVQMSSIIQSNDTAVETAHRERKEKLLDAAFKELGNDIIQYIPNKQQILETTKQNPCTWNPIDSFKKSDRQSDASYEEQKLAINVTINAINKYRDVTNAHRLTKNVGIRGFPGGGKTWCGLYCVVYAMSCGLDCIATAMMARRASSLGGIHWHKFLKISCNDSKLTPQRNAELAMQNINRDPLAIHAIRSIDVILADELGQLSAEFVSTINIILCRTRCNYNIFGGVLLIGTLDHTQIQPWQGRPFLSSSLIVPTFTMVQLSQSVRTQVPENYELQQIARMNHNDLKSNPNYVARFRDLASNIFKFVDSWSDNAITKSTFRVYSKRVPVVEAAKDFIAKVKTEYINRPNELRIRNCLDTFRLIGSRMDWREASTEISNDINSQTKVAPTLCFFKGAVFECTYNDRNGTFLNSDAALLYDIPTAEDLESWKPVKVLRVPAGWKDFDFDMSITKEEFIRLGFMETKVPIAPDYIIKKGNMQVQRKQYGLRHRITGTIHGSMGDTYESMASEVSNHDTRFGMWDKGMLVVLISRTKVPSQTIFVGPKQSTLDVLESVLLRKTMWTDYVEKQLAIITINSNTSTIGTEAQRVMTPDLYPFRIADMRLPATNTGIVYMLNSLRQRSYVYIGKTKNPRVRLYNHNAGYGSESTEPVHLRPFAVMAYISGFEGNEELMLAVERKWKVQRDYMLRQGIYDPRLWARAGACTFDDSNLQRHYNIQEYRLSLTLLFYDNLQARDVTDR